MLRKHRNLIFPFVQLNTNQTGKVVRLARITLLNSHRNEVGALEKCHAPIINEISGTNIADGHRLERLIPARGQRQQ